MENFVKRLIVEHKELTEKRKALEDIISRKIPNTLNKRELLLLGAQSVIMDKYIEILEDRLAEHDVEAENGLYKKIITVADVLRNDSENQSELNSDCGALS